MRAQYWLKGLAVVLVLLGLCLPGSGQSQEEGVWLDLDEPEERDSDSTAFADDNTWFEVAGDSADADFFSDVFLTSDMEFRQSNLQDILRDNLLLEEESERLTEIFSADSSLALSLYQLRGETFPRYHLLSDLWIYIWRGRGKLFISEEELSYGPGQFLQIPAGTLHAFSNISGAPTVGLVWQRPPMVDSLMVEIIPAEVLEQMEADSLRMIELQERSLYKTR